MITNTAAFAALAAALVVASPALAAPYCAEYGKFRSTHMHDDRMSMDLTTYRGDQYLVTFTNECKVGAAYSLNHFVYTDLLVGTCVSSGDVWPTNRLGPCWVKSVEPASN